MTDTQHLDLGPEIAASPAATFRSVLYACSEDDLAAADEPPFFADLNLDQVVEEVVTGREEYALTPFFYLPLRNVDAVEYRHEVCRDLEDGDLRAAVLAFAEAMRRVRRFVTLTKKQHYRYEQQRWFLDAVCEYCDAISALHIALDDLDLGSRGLRGLRRHLATYTSSDRFTLLSSEAESVEAGLDRVRYTLRIRGARVTVSTYEEERDYSVEVEETFARFRHGGVEDHLLSVADPGSMDHVEARIARLVARLYPNEFRSLDDFCGRWRDFLDPVMDRFDREVQFYLAYLEHTERLSLRGLSFCYPAVSVDSKEIAVEDAFDIALAAKLAGEGSSVVCNDFFLQGTERVLVVTGPNQGGKTTFARMVGQLHHLAGLGLPVPGSTVRVFLPDGVFAHFEREEDIRTLRGKLDDELVRVREIVDRACGDSLVILNEIFASTSLSDALYLGTEILTRLIDLGCLVVCVTFVDELASLSEATVSMVANVAPDDPSQRTFKVVRRPADGRAYAWALAEKYGLSSNRLEDRIGR